MPTPLEKARKNPGSMKARILRSARHLFGEYGYHGVTTRMIANEVGIDISTLHYHWGDKENLYEAVIIDINDEMKKKLLDIEKLVSGKSIVTRLEVAIEVMCDYLFANPEVSKLTIASFFNKTRPDGITDGKLIENIPEIAIAMGLAKRNEKVPPHSAAMVLAISNAMYSFTSGEKSFKNVLDVERDEYITVVKDTLKFILIPAFDKKNKNKAVN